MANGDPWKCLRTEGHSGERLGVFSPQKVSPRDASQGPSLGGAGRWAGRMAAGRLLPIPLYRKNWPRNLLMGCANRPPQRASCQARQWGPAPGRGLSLPALWRVLSEYTHRHRQTVNKRNASLTATQLLILALRSV